MFRVRDVEPPSDTAPPPESPVPPDTVRDEFASIVFVTEPLGRETAPVAVRFVVFIVVAFIVGNVAVLLNTVVLLNVWFVVQVFATLVLGMLAAAGIDTPPIFMSVAFIVPTTSSL